MRSRVQVSLPLPKNQGVATLQLLFFCGLCIQFAYGDWDRHLRYHPNKSSIRPLTSSMRYGGRYSSSSSVSSFTLSCMFILFFAVRRVSISDICLRGCIRISAQGRQGMSASLAEYVDMRCANEHRLSSPAILQKYPRNSLELRGRVYSSSAAKYCLTKCLRSRSQSFSTAFR